ncbi:FxLD family lanthipeptide [Rhizohabitans arisaemae]|uniref:FxLD family lanthipeptide n=1 Tax=Rhizohabitans arisaemae TaxID=2720610 RepID=UPI0024B1ADC7|nr:FxLD family lanthipeptide [Rhizohabitans arisaemae]
MSMQAIARRVEPHQHVADDADDPFHLDITFIENTPAAETVLMCSTGDNCGSSCPSACTTS